MCVHAICRSRFGSQEHRLNPLQGSRKWMFELILQCVPLLVSCTTLHTYARNRYGSIMREWMHPSIHPHLSIHPPIHSPIHPSIHPIHPVHDGGTIPSFTHLNCVHACFAEMVFKSITLILSKEAKRRHFSLFSGDIASVLVQVSYNFSHQYMHVCKMRTINDFVHTHTVIIIK